MLQVSEFVLQVSPKNTQISHKSTKIWESTGPFVMKLGSLVPLMLLQKRYAGILKILIFWPVAPRGRFKNSIFSHF